MDLQECLIRSFLAAESHLVYCHVERDLSMMVLFLQRQSQCCGGDREVAAQASQSGCGTGSGEGRYASEEC